MAAGARSGAQQRVLRAIGLAATGGDRPREGALCPVCRERELEFIDGEFGQILEQCPNARCPNHAPHRPVPTA